MININKLNIISGIFFSKKYSQKNTIPLIFNISLFAKIRTKDIAY